MQRTWLDLDVLVRFVRTRCRAVVVHRAGIIHRQGEGEAAVGFILLPSIQLKVKKAGDRERIKQHKAENHSAS